MESYATVYLQREHAQINTQNKDTNSKNERDTASILHSFHLLSFFILFFYALIHTWLLLQPINSPVKTYQSQDLTHEDINSLFFYHCSRMYVYICALHEENTQEEKMCF